MLDVYHNLPVSHDLDDGKIRSRDVITENQIKFSSLLLEPQIQDGLTKCGYMYLSPIQQNALPLVLTGSSVIAHAKSGTGKTLIYVLPVLNEFIKQKSNNLQCLVVAPTREIAKQIFDVFRNLACFIEDLQIEFFIGGTPLDMDVIKCKKCHVAIGAPGRIKHLIDLGFLKTTDLQLLVLDEVDALFDHKEYAIADIISILPPVKQLIVCTATFSSKIGDLIKSFIPNVKYTSAEKLEIEETGSISNMLIAIKQYVAPVETDYSSTGAMRKRDKLVEILKNFKFEQCFIFVNYMTLVRSICKHLISQNFPALWICGDQNQSARINTINKLKMNHCKILVTTDLAARGIDVHKVNLVINLGLPCPPDIYIHRMGRAGRYGSKGAVVTILNEGEEMTTFTKMISVVSTDPVSLHILPRKIDCDFSNLEIIQCTPTEGSISEDEFLFKRQMKNNQEIISGGTKKKRRKIKKKKMTNSNHMTKSTLQDDITDQSVSAGESNIEDKMANKENCDSISSELVNQKIDQFCVSLANRLASGKPKFELNSVKLLLGLKNDNSIVDESFAFMPNPPSDLLTCTRHVKQMNELIDDQIMPCSVDEFLSTFDHDGDTVDRLSFGMCSLIKEISAKIGEPFKQKQKACPAVSLIARDQPSENSSRASSQSFTEESLKVKYKKVDVVKNSRKSGEQSSAQSLLAKVPGKFNLSAEFSAAMMNDDNEGDALTCRNVNSKQSPKSSSTPTSTVETKRDLNFISVLDPEKKMKSKPGFLPDLKSNAKSALVSKTKNTSSIVDAKVHQVFGPVSENSVYISFSSPDSVSESNPIQIFDYIEARDDIDAYSGSKTKSVIFRNNITQNCLEHVEDPVKKFAIYKQNDFKVRNTLEDTKNSIQHFATYDENDLEVQAIPKDAKNLVKNVATDKQNGIKPRKCITNHLKNVVDDRNMEKIIPEDSRYSLKSGCHPKNWKQSLNNVPISTSATAHYSSPPCDLSTVPLPSLQSYVSPQQEQNIWRHHFAFIKHRIVSRSRVVEDHLQ